MTAALRATWGPPDLRGLLWPSRPAGRVVPETLSDDVRRGRRRAGLGDQQAVLSVKPLPDKSCFVRYGAAVLLLVAIALLVLLVFFGR